MHFHKDDDKKPYNEYLSTWFRPPPEKRNLSVAGKQRIFKLAKESYLREYPDTRSEHLNEIAKIAKASFKTTHFLGKFRWFLKSEKKKIEWIARVVIIATDNNPFKDKGSRVDSDPFKIFNLSAGASKRK